MMTPDLNLETELWGKGFKLVVGIDEAGRGPWAGPVTAGAVVLDKDCEVIKTVRDSKKMNRISREDAFEKIKETVLAWGVGVIDAQLIDEWGIATAIKMAMQSALSQVEEMLGSKADFLIIDGGNVQDFFEYKTIRVNKGDSLHYSIAAASVLAKVQRDLIMGKYALKYPEFGFESHVGYGTQKHREALLKYGPCEIHRKSYRPIKELL